MAGGFAISATSATIFDQAAQGFGPLDVVMVPCGGIYGLNGNEARTVIDHLKPKQFILPMHIGNARYDDLLPVDEFIDDSPYPCAIVRDRGAGL